MRGQRGAHVLTLALGVLRIGEAVALRVGANHAVSLAPGDASHHGVAGRLYVAKPKTAKAGLPLQS
jgi:hypothetical protein